MKKTSRKASAVLCAMALAVAMPVQFAIADEEVGTVVEPVASEAVEPMSAVDSDYDFNFSFTGATQATAGRPKEDATSAYLKVTGKSIQSCNVYIDGSYGLAGTYVNRTINRSSGQAGGSATVTSIGQFQIYNNVNESGMSYAKLTGWAAGYTGWMYGKWSPDCVGCNRYPVINNY